MEAHATLAAIGERLREIRKSAGMSLRDLAAKAEMSASFLSLVERGESSLSLTSLFAIAQALDVDPAEVVGGGNEQGHSKAEYAVWRHADRDGKHRVMGEREYGAFSAELAGASLKPLFVRVHPTTAVTPTLGHDGEEVAVVLSGTLTFFIRDDIVEVSAGDSIHFSSRIPHSIANRTDQDVEAIWLTAGGTAGFHHESS